MIESLLPENGPSQEEMNHLMELFSSGRFPDVEALTREWSVLFPQQGIVWKALGTALTLQGRIDDALTPMQRAADLMPGDAETHYNLGVILGNLGRLEDEVASYRRALLINLDYAVAHGNLGTALKELGRLDEALASYRRALQNLPDWAEVHNYLATTLMELGHLDDALLSYDRAIELKPDYVEAYCNRGLLLQNLKRLDEALVSIDRAIELQPDLAKAHFNRGAALQKLERLDDALASYNRAIALKPDFAEAHFNRGVALERLKRLDEALVSYDRAITFKPDYPGAHFNRGTTLQNLRNFNQALSSFDQALLLKPDYADAYSNRGAALHNLERFDEALVSIDRALALKPDFPEAHFNRGVALQSLKRLEEALSSYNRAIALKPDYVAAQYNKSLLLILRGDYALGWELYECRWKQEPLAALARNFKQPLWLGANDLAGKTILLHAEQGFGDTIQFCRFAPALAAQGAQVILEVQATLVEVIRTLGPTVSVIERGAPLPEFDYHCPMMSLPLAFKTRLENIPAKPDYLSALPSKKQVWSGKLGSANKLRVGIVWSGSATHKKDIDRSIDLSLLSPLFVLNAEFHCMQKETRSIDRSTLQTLPGIRTWERDLADFSDTATLASMMDVVISVDTAVAHLAGALGTPTWVLLPYVPDYRWLLDRDDSPWYPSVRLFRQPSLGDWQSAISRIADELGVVVRRGLVAEPAPQ